MFDTSGEISSSDEDELMLMLLGHGDEGWDSDDDDDDGDDTDMGEGADDEGQSWCYEMPCIELPCRPAYLPHVLTVQKHEHQDHFHLALHVSPNTFNCILEQILDDPVFSNNSPNGQLPMDTQLTTALYHFGHNGNAASGQHVANWARVGKGTVTLVT